MITDCSKLRKALKSELDSVETTDVHTHLYPASFDGMLLWGIDEVLTYHYLIAEYFRYSSMDYGEFFDLPKQKQADLIWNTLFLDRTPVSESQRGVLTILKRLGLDVRSRSLKQFREYFRDLKLEQQIDKVFELAGVKEVIMTNDPFDPREKDIWKNGYYNEDSRFKAALRIDPLLMDYKNTYRALQSEGYAVTSELDKDSTSEIRHFLKNWIEKMDALYLAVSLPPNFTVFDDSPRTRLIKECVLPVCAEKGIPLALMIGVNKLVNEKLGLAGDSLGKTDIGVIEYLCTNYPDNKFLVTMLSRENQHELAITARKYKNLMVFGCWWFLNNPSLVKEITQMRMETLGFSFIPQHSDARVLEHLIYKWEHSKEIIGQVLAEKYTDVMAAGWTLTKKEISRDVQEMFHGNFKEFINR